MTALPAGGARPQRALPAVPRKGGLLRGYIQEAHPSDAWQLNSNVRDNVVFASTRTAEERSAVAGTCVRKLGLEIPALLDNPANTTEAAYTGWPDRLYVVDGDGRIAYKSAAGPFGFQPQGVRETLERLRP